MKCGRSPVVFACIAATFIPFLSALGAERRPPKTGATPTSPPPGAAAANAMRTTVQADQKEIADDRVALTKATKDLEDAAAKLNADFDATPAVADAKSAVADAAAAEQAARQTVMAKLADDPAHKAAVQKESDARRQLDDLRNSGASQDTISAKADEVFKAGGETSKIERAAETADPAFAAAQKKLEDANATLASLRAKFKESLKTDSSLATLRQAKQDAQAKLAAAQTKLEADRKGATPAAASGGY